MESWREGSAGVTGTLCRIDLMVGGDSVELDVGIGWNGCGRDGDRGWRDGWGLGRGGPAWACGDDNGIARSGVGMLGDDDCELLRAAFLVDDDPPGTVC